MGNGKVVCLNKTYFCCMHINVMCQLMQQGIYPYYTKRSKKDPDKWIWYFSTTAALINALKEIFQGYEIVVAD